MKAGLVEDFLIPVHLEASDLTVLQCPGDPTTRRDPLAVAAVLPAEGLRKIGKILGALVQEFQRAKSLTACRRIVQQHDATGVR